MSEFTNDSLIFTVKIIAILIIFSVVFGPEGIAIQTFQFSIYTEPIMLQNHIASAFNIGSFSPGNFSNSVKTSGSPYTIKISTDSSGTKYVHVFPTGKTYLNTNFALVNPTPIISKCAIQDQEITLRKGIIETVIIEKIEGVNGCSLSIITNAENEVI